jgi:dUTP pyrophosphatase
MQVELMPHAVGVPTYATEHSAGMDLYAAVTHDVRLGKGQTYLVPTGVKIALPVGHEAQIRPRSGLAAKQSVTVLNSPGTIDADYRGEIKVILINHGQTDFTITRGERIAQMVVAKYEAMNLYQVNGLDKTSRGVGGFGSTGA